MLRKLLPFIFIFLVALVLMGKMLFGLVFSPADMLSHLQPWSEINSSEKDIQWNPLLWDSLAQFYPWRNFLAESFRQGFLPLWNPYQFCGTPFYANGQSAIFYPFNWLSPFLGRMFFGFSALLHLFLAGLLIYLFLRKINLSSYASLFSALAFMLSSFITAWLHLPTVISSFVWAPLALLGVELALEGEIWKSFLACSTSIGLSALGGHPQFLLYTLWLIILYLLLRLFGERRVSLLNSFFPLLFAGVGLLLSSVAFLPLFELSRLAHRAESPSWQSYNAYISLSLPLERLIGLFLPNFFGNPAKGNYWGGGEYIEYALYLGILPLFALPYAIKGDKKHAIPLMLIALLSLLLIIGTPLNIPFYFLVPAWSQTGSPARLISVFTLCLTALAGVGIDALLYSIPTRRSLLITASTIILFPFLLFSLAGREEPFATLRGVSPSFPYLDFLKLFLFPIITYFLLRFGRKLLTYFLIPLLLLDLFPIASSHLYFSSPDKLFPPLPFSKELKGSSYRVLTISPHWSLYRYPFACLPPNTSMVYHIFDVGGYDSLFLLSYKSFLDGLEGKNTAPLENGNMLLPSSVSKRNLSLLGVKFVLSPIYIDASYLELLRDGETKLYRFSQNPLRFDLVDKSFRLQGRVKLIKYLPNEVEFEFEGDKEGYFLLNDTYYPGWRAFLDGEEKEILPYYVFRSVPVPAGKHHLVFLFQPFTFKLGFYITLLSILLICSLLSFKSICKK